MKAIEYTEESQIKELIRFHNDRSSYIVIDTETTGLDPFTDHITDIILSGHSESEVITFSAKFVELLRDIRRPLVAHNFKFDFRMCLQHGVDLRIPGLFADTLLLDHLLDENAEHSLDAIVQREFGDNYKEVFWGKYDTFQEAPRQEQIEYSCKDVLYTGAYYRTLAVRLRCVEKVPETLIKHVHALALSLYDTEVEGINLDISYLSSLSTELTSKIQELKADLSNAVPYDIAIIESELFEKELEKRKTLKGKNSCKRPVFDWESPLQVSKLLYDQLELDEQYNIKTHNRTVDDAALQILDTKHGIIPKLRQYRGYQKIFSAFIDGSIKRMRTGRIYPSFNINGTVTGRIASSNPNLQQLPRDGNIRAIYVPRNGYSFIASDYNQLEVTLAAHFSRDENLLKIVHEGASQHDITAKGLGIDRQLAKTINFALQYGAGVHKIKSILDCGYEDAELAYNKYWETYKGLHNFVKRCHKQVEDGEPLVNPFGRKRRFPTTFNTKWELERAKRQAANAFIQGTGADLTNRAFYLVHQELKKLPHDRALFPIHDEILIEVADEHTYAAECTLQKIMVGVGQEINLTVPLKVQSSGAMKCWKD